MDHEESKCKTCGNPLHDACVNECHDCGAKLCDKCSATNKFRCEDCNDDTNDAKSLSVEYLRRSDIEDYEECPYKVFCKLDNGLESLGNIYSKAGVDLHDLFDRASKGRLGARVGDHETRNKLFQEWDGVFRRYETQEFEGCQRKLTVDEFKESMYQKGRRCIQNYWEWEQKQPAPWKTEETLFNKFDESLPSARITFDRINPIPGSDMYELIDYKTGKPIVGKALSSNLQAPLYILNVENEYNIKIKRFVFVFLDGNGKGSLVTRIFERVDDDKFECKVGSRTYTISLQETVRRIKKVFSRIMNNDWNIPQNVNLWKCDNQCEIPKRGLCEGGTAQSWNNAWKGYG